MIGFTWLQWRTQAAVAAAGLVAVAIGLAVTGPHLAHLYNANVATCAAHGDCSVAVSAFLQNDRALRTWLAVLVVVVPGLTGVFWGAPLIAREFETGTYRLAWTQSVTRTRWLAVRLTVIGLASMAVAGLLSVMATWWASPIDRANMDIYKSFDQHDIVPIGYAALAFVLGVTAGALIRRTLPAMATTLGAFVFVRLGVTHWVRPHLIAPVHTAIELDAVTPGAIGYGTAGSGPDTLLPSAPHIANAWTYSTRLVDAAGHALTPQYVATACPALASGGQGGAPPVGSGNFHKQVPASAQAVLHDCVARVGATFHEAVTYQPGSRYWRLQWYELAIYLAVAGVLAAFCVWWVRRRQA